MASSCAAESRWIPSRCRNQCNLAFALCLLSDLLVEEEVVLPMSRIHVECSDQIHLIQNQKEGQEDLECTPHTPGKRGRPRANAARAIPVQQRCAKRNFLSKGVVRLRSSHRAQGCQRKSGKAARGNCSDPAKESG